MTSGTDGAPYSATTEGIPDGQCVLSQSACAGGVTNFVINSPKRLS